eukprot:8992543-Pyramimonas_sp.AAC.2
MSESTSDSQGGVGGLQASRTFSRNAAGFRHSPKGGTITKVTARAWRVKSARVKVARRNKAHAIETVTGWNTTTS